MLAISGDEIWPTKDYSRIPYWLFTDENMYRQELDKIFYGPTWNYVGLEAEIPDWGDFKTTYVGETPIILSRAKDGGLVALVNRCGHRGAMVRRERFGNEKTHTCIYHRWCYSIEGDLIGIPFKRGVNGKGGLDKAFDEKEHGLKRLRIESFKGMMFVTFDHNMMSLPDYLGPLNREQISRIMCKPVRILGFQKQVINGNWKLYQENLRDTYHASLLHSFFVTFGLDRVTNPGGTKLDESKGHSFVYNRPDPAASNSLVNEDSTKVYASEGVKADRVNLEDTWFLGFHEQYPDDMRLYLACLFPNAHYQQMNNCLNTRQMIPRGPNAFEVIWTIFGYEDDDEELADLRKHQANFIGPAGFVSMEDAEVIENMQTAFKDERHACSVVEMGGRGPIIADSDNKVNEIPIRGFWSLYARLMGIEPTGGER
jgi:anthranilate 1,2-dioxygenase large subunit